MSPFFTAVWPVLAAWIVTYILDYALTLVGARRYREWAKGSSEPAKESYELNPAFQKDIDALKPFSPKFVMLLIYWLAVLGLAGLFSRYRPALDWVFPGLSGAILVPEALIIIRHVNNLFMFTLIRKMENPPPTFFLPHALANLLSAVSMYAFAVLFLLLGLAAGHPFLYGGAAGCLISGEWMRNWSQKARKTAPQAKAA